jgi:hypothetical protein
VFARASLVLLAALLVPWPGRAITVSSPFELVLASDVSGTVDTAEFDQNRLAYANAFRDPAVQALITSGGGIVATLVYWAGDGVQVQAVPWTPLIDAADANAFAALIEAAPRATGTLADAGQTGMTRALDFSRGLFSNSVTSDLENTFASPRRVIDVAGDGTENLDSAPSPFLIQIDLALSIGNVIYELTYDPGWGAAPVARDAALAAGIAINGLPIRPKIFDPPTNTNEQTETADATRVSETLAELFPPPTDFDGDPFSPADQALVDAGFAAAFQDFEVGLLAPGQTEINLHEWFYRDFVVGGPDAFLVFADDFDAVEGAIRTKLLREIPEPGSLGLAALGAAALLLARRR